MNIDKQKYKREIINPALLIPEYISIERAVHAMNGAIIKWEKICDGWLEDNGVRNCPLCELFYKPTLINDDTFTACVGCPIQWYTGCCICWGTPYENWVEWHRQTKWQCLPDYTFVFNNTWKPKPNVFNIEGYGPYFYISPNTFHVDIGPKLKYVVDDKESYLLALDELNFLKQVRKAWYEKIKSYLFMDKYAGLSPTIALKNAFKILADNVS